MKIDICIVEDDQNYRETLRDIFEFEDGFKCLNIENSVEDFFKNKPSISPDIILLDIDLPGMKGTDAIDTIKNMYPKTKIIMLTIFDNDDHIFNAMCRGADGYLLKSVPLEMLLNALKDVLNDGAAMSPYIASRVIGMFQKYTQPRQEYNLTPQEKNVLSLLVNGKNKKILADELFISVHTVETHLKKIYQKLQVHSQIDLVAKALKEQLI